mgnify:CR=1 FL=1
MPFGAWRTHHLAGLPRCRMRGRSRGRGRYCHQSQDTRSLLLPVRRRYGQGRGQMSMSEMMALAENNGNAGDKNENGGEMKMPAGMPKVGKMPDWVKKRIEARKKARQEGKKDVLPEVPMEEKEFSFAVLEIERTLKNVLKYRDLLAASPEKEQQAILHALNGGYLAPTPGGDVVLAPNTLPTGRNIYSINAEMTPSTRAWDNGKALVETTLRQYFAKHNAYPRKVSYTFWAGEFIETFLLEPLSPKRSTCWESNPCVTAWDVSPICA